MFHQTLRHQRKLRGLTQSALAAKSGVSLATIQNLEAGHGNPELSTIQSLCKALGMELQVRPRQIDWEDLIPYGLPLMSLSSPSALRPHRESLQRRLAAIGPHLESLSPNSREGVSLAALLMALRDHYPSVWKQTDPQLTGWLAQFKSKRSLIKLRRISLARLGQYL